jgi:hypothetical protein
MHNTKAIIRLLDKAFIAMSTNYTHNV